jgi:hypothetical protein
VSDATSDPNRPIAEADQPATGFDIYCHECGYNLRGISEPRCPECGKESPALLNAEPSIPWIHRKQIGNVRAFLKTVLFATFSPRKLSEDVYLHIDFRDAQKFRRWAIAVAMFWMIGMTITLHVAGAQGRLTDPTILNVLGMYWPSVVFNGLVLLYLILATGIPSLFFDYRDVPINLRNNAIALSYYCIAPLCWGPVVVVSSIAVMRDSLDSHRFAANNAIEITLIFVGIAGPFVPVGAGLYSLLQVAGRVLRGQTGRKVWMTIGIPMLWLLSAIVVFALIPLAGFYVWVLVDALS